MSRLDELKARDATWSARHPSGFGRGNASQAAEDRRFLLELLAMRDREVAALFENAGKCIVCSTGMSVAEHDAALREEARETPHTFEPEGDEPACARCGEPKDVQLHAGSL